MSSDFTKPVPEIDVWNKPFWDAAKQHKLAMLQCKSCDLLRFPPGPTCPCCLSCEQEWTEVSGYGKVRSWVVFHQLYYKSFADELPYNVALVELDEGPRLMTNLVGINNHDIKMDMKVKVIFDDTHGDFTIPKFKPAE